MIYFLNCHALPIHNKFLVHSQKMEIWISESEYTVCFYFSARWRNLFAGCYDWLFESQASQLLTSSVSQWSSGLLQRHLTSIYLQGNKEGKRNFDNWNEKARRMKKRMKKIGSRFWLSISASSILEKKSLCFIFNLKTRCKYTHKLRDFKNIVNAQLEQNYFIHKHMFYIISSYIKEINIILSFFNALWVIDY